MFLIRTIASLGVVLVLVSTAWAQSGSPVVKSEDGMELRYQTEVQGECTVSIWLKREPSGRGYLSLNRAPLLCLPTLSGDLAAIERLLTAITDDGVNLADFQFFGLGRIEQVAWKQEIIDCYLQHRSKNEDLHRLAWNLPKLLTKCGIFLPLEQTFEKFRVKVTLKSIEKIETVNLRNAHVLRRERLGDEWIRKHSRYRGVVPIGGIFGFEMTPELR